MNDSHILTAEQEIQAIKERISDREKTMSFLKIQNATDKKALKTFTEGLEKLKKENKANANPKP